jgi:hypothetical protein
MAKWIAFLHRTANDVPYSTNVIPDKIFYRTMANGYLAVV